MSRRVDGDKVRRVREKRWMGVEDLARETGYNANTIYQMESGYRKSFHRSTILAIARALDVHPDDLLEDSEKE